MTRAKKNCIVVGSASALAAAAARAQRMRRHTGLRAFLVAGAAPIALPPRAPSPGPFIQIEE